MVISDKYKIIFLRNPKCASSSIRNILIKFDKSFWGDSLKYVKKISKYFNISEKLQSSAQLLFEGMSRINKDISNYFVFGTIRNPWDRMVSQFTYGQVDKKFNCFYQKEYCLKDGFCSFEDYIKSGNFLKVNIKNWFYYNEKIVTNYIYNMENFEIKKLEEDYENFSGKKINLPKMIHINKTKHKHKNYKEYYNEETKNIIQLYYQEDIDYGNYVF